MDGNYCAGGGLHNFKGDAPKDGALYPFTAMGPNNNHINLFVLNDLQDLFGRVAEFYPGFQFGKICK